MWDEINSLTPVLEKASDTPQKARKQFEDMLEDAYLLGWFMVTDAAGESEDFQPTRTQLDEMLSQSYDGESIIAKFEKYFAKAKENKTVTRAIKDITSPPSEDEESPVAPTAGDITRLAESEAHRAFNQGAYECAKALGGDFEKEWNTMGDERVRDTHQYLEGARVPVDALFYTFDGDSAMYPGGFTSKENNVNCRCWLVYIPN